MSETSVLAAALARIVRRPSAIARATAKLAGGALLLEAGADGRGLKVVFNEKGTSGLQIVGVKMSSGALGLAAQAGSAFQSNAAIDATPKNGYIRYTTIARPE